MAGMWELPELQPGESNGDVPLTRLRHSITDTDYQIALFAVGERDLLASEVAGRWLTGRQWERLPLTGLTRKILRRLQLESKPKVAESKC
jgi:hypothetical protein